MKSSIRELLSKTLALAEYEVDTAPDGRAGVERLRLGHYDLLIADLKMPGMDGFPSSARPSASRPTCRSSSSPASPPSRAPSRRSISASPAISPSRSASRRSWRRRRRPSASSDPASIPNQIIRRKGSPRERHVADRRARSGRPVRSERRRQDHAAQDAGRARRARRRRRPETEWPDPRLPASGWSHPSRAHHSSTRRTRR